MNPGKLGRPHRRGKGAVAGGTRGRLDDAPLRPLDWLVLVGIVVIVAVILGDLGYGYLRPHSSAREEDGGHPAATASTPPAVLTSPLERARDWRDHTLAGTDFAGLSLREDAGRCYLVYSAREDDSLLSVLHRYGSRFRARPAVWGEIVQAARERHTSRYQYDVRPGDEIWLLVPCQTTPASASARSSLEGPSGGGG